MGRPDDFWTISDGRPGQAAENPGTTLERLPPLEDNTLCHFAAGRIVASYAHLAFEADSYQAMDAAACLPPRPPAASSSECWFGGEALPFPQIGAFQLHWNGNAVEEQPYPQEGHAVRDLRALEGALFESVEVGPLDRVSTEPVGRAPVLHLIEGGTVAPETGNGELPLYGSEREPTDALGFLHLAAAEGALWAAAGAGAFNLSGEQEHGQVTVARRVAGIWTQVIGASSSPLPTVLSSRQEEAQLLGGEAKAARVTAIAAEPGSEDAWLALAPQSLEASEGVSAVLVHISAQGQVLGEQTLPSAQEREVPIGPKGAADKLACVAVEDCWLATTKGWLYHLARGRNDPAGQRTPRLPARQGRSAPANGRPIRASRRKCRMRRRRTPPG